MFLLPRTSHTSPQNPKIQAKRVKQDASGTIRDIIAENPHQEESKKEKEKQMSIAIPPSSMKVVFPRSLVFFLPM
jgi:hypothetical protein